MSRKKLTRRTRRIGIALLFAAMAIPATAQAHPFDDTIPSRGAIHGSSPQIIKVPTDPGQARVTDERPLPRGVVLRKSGPVDQGPKLAPVSITSVQQTSTFDWTDALIGAGVTAAIMALALGGALVARQQGRLAVAKGRRALTGPVSPSGSPVGSGERPVGCWRMLISSVPRPASPVGGSGCRALGVSSETEGGNDRSAAAPQSPARFLWP